MPSILVVGAIIVHVAYQNVDGMQIRGIGSYVGFAVAFCGTYYYRLHFGPIRKLLSFVIVVWLLSGILQVLAGPYFLDFLVLVRTSTSRGVTGLSPEPSFFGTALVYLALCLYLETKTKPTRSEIFLIVCCIVSVVLVAKSAVGVLLIPFAVLCAVQSESRSGKRFIAVSLLVLISYALMLAVLTLIPDSRVALVLASLVADPINLIQQDQSVSGRVSHIVYSVYLHIADHGFPHGFAQFSTDSFRLAQQLKIFFLPSEANKIMSSTGAALYELGYFGYAYIAIIAACVQSSMSSGNLKAKIIRFLCLLALFSTAVPISLPIIPVLLVTLIFSKSEQRQIR